MSNSTTTVLPDYFSGAKIDFTGASDLDRSKFEILLKILISEIQQKFRNVLRVTPTPDKLSITISHSQSDRSPFLIEEINHQLRLLKDSISLKLLDSSEIKPFLGKIRAQVEVPDTFRSLLVTINPLAAGGGCSGAMKALYEAMDYFHLVHDPLNIGFRGTNNIRLTRLPHFDAHENDLPSFQDWVESFVGAGHEIKFV